MARLRSGRRSHKQDQLNSNGIPRFHDFFSRGTGSSNPSPSSRESRANLNLLESRAAKISNGPGFGFKPLGAGLTGTSGADAGIVYQDVDPIRRRLDRTEDLVRRRRALAHLLQLEEQPAAALRAVTGRDPVVD